MPSPLYEILPIFLYLAKAALICVLAYYTLKTAIRNAIIEAKEWDESNVKND